MRPTALRARSRWRLVVTGLAVGLSAAATPAAARVVESIAAVVGNEIILQSEVEDHAKPLLRELARIGDAAQRTARATAVRREILDRLIDDELILLQANELRLSVTGEEIDRSIEQIKKENNLSAAQLRDALQAQGMSMASYRQDLKKQILRFRVLNIAVGARLGVSDKDVEDYYERHVKSGTNVQVRASHIFIAIPEDADAAAVAEREARAKELLAQAKDGKDFAILARQFSEDAATRQDGGDLGYFGRDMLPKAIEELVFSMKVGDVRGPLRADRGFHVIKLVDRKNVDARPLAEVRENIRAQLRDQEMKRQTKIYLSDLRKKTLIDVRM